MAADAFYEFRLGKSSEEIQNSLARYCLAFSRELLQRILNIIEHGIDIYSFDFWIISRKQQIVQT